MKKIKKLIAVSFLCLTMLLPQEFALAAEEKKINEVESASNPATIEVKDNVIYITTNEYDMYVSQLQNDKAKLMAVGYSEEEIAVSRTYEAENRLYERAKLSEDVLKSAYGYSDEQIAILQEYEGQPLEEYPEMRAVLPEMNASISAGTCTTKNIIAHLAWEWSDVPAIYCYEDSIAVSFAAVQNDEYKTVRYNTAYTNSYVQYYNYLSGQHMSTVATDIISQNVYANCETRFDRLVASNDGYVKKGSFNCYINFPFETTSEIEYAYFIFAYGCPRTAATYSIGFPLTLTIEFGEHVDKALYVQATITSTGQVTVDELEE